MNNNYSDNNSFVNGINNNYSSSNNYNLNNTVQKKNKFLWVIVALLVILVIGFIGYKFLGNKESNSASVSIDSIFDPNKLIKIKKDDLYGFINSSGKMVIKPTYEDASDFYGNYAIVQVTYKDEYGRDVEGNAVIDTKGKVQLQSEYDVNYIQEYNVFEINNSIYDSSLKKLSGDSVSVYYIGYGYFNFEDTKDNTAGIMNYKGQKNYVYKYQENENYISVDASNISDSIKQRYCKINIENEKYAIVNCDTGAVAYDFTENYISGYSDNIFDISNHNTFEQIEQVYIQDDKVLYKTENVDVRISYDDTYLSITDYSKEDYSERYTYFDLKTNKLVTERPKTTSDDDVDVFKEITGLTKFRCDNGYGLKEGENVVVECSYDDFDYVDSLLNQYLVSKGKRYVYALKDSKTYIYDVKSKENVYEFNTSYISDYWTSYSTFLTYRDKDTNEDYVYNILTNKQMKIENNEYTINSNYFTITKDNKVYYYNTNFDMIYQEDK